MRQAFQRLPYKWLFLTIAGIMIAGMLLPYISFRQDSYYPDVFVYYGWEWLSFQLQFSIASGMLLVSLSRKIAIRLIVIRLLLVLQLPVLFFILLWDNQPLDGYGYLIYTHLVGCYLSYVGFICTFLYGFLHFRKSYPIYKQLLREHEKQSSDILDNF